MSKQTLFKAVSIIAVITILSKLAGFIRDLVVAQAYGASITSDAYFYAYQIPSLALILLGGLGGPFHTATIAVFGKLLLKSDNNKEANKLLNAFITYTFIAFTIITIIVCLFAEPIIKLITPAASPELQHIAAGQMVIMSPVIIIGGIIGIFYGISNIYEKFVWSSLSPLVASIVMIIAVLCFKNTPDGFILGISTLIGSAGMLLVQLPEYFKIGFRFLPEFNLKLDGFKQIGEILFPAMIGTTIGQTNIYVNMFFVSSLPAGSWTAIVYSNRLIQLPIGVLLTAMLVPIFPMFTKFVAENDINNLKYYAHKAIVSLWFLAFPMLIYIILFAQDGVKVLLERGEFNSHDTKMVSEALIFLAFSMIPYLARDTITRIFYAYDDSKTPLLVGLFSIFVNALLVWILVKPLGIGGVNLTTTLVTLVNMILLTILIRRKVKDISLRKIIKPTSKIILASLIMLATCYMFNQIWLSYVESTKLYIFIKLCIMAMVGFGTYGASTILLGLDESKSFTNKILAKLKIRKNS